MSLPGKGSRFASQSVVDIQLSCRNLPPGQDPFCVLHRLEAGPRGDHYYFAGGAGGAAAAASHLRHVTTNSERRLGSSGGGGDHHDNLGVLVPPSYPTLHEQELGRTEVVLQCCHPDFEVSFRIDYRFEEEQYYCARCYSEQSDSAELQTHAFLGGFYFNMGQLLGAVGNTLCMPLMHLNQNRPQATGCYCFVRGIAHQG